MNNSTYLNHPIRIARVFIFLLLCLCLWPISRVFGQTTCLQMEADARQAADDGQYRMAIQRYNAAKRCDPSRANQIDAFILEVFDRINELKEAADAAGREQKRQANLGPKSTKGNQCRID